MFGRREEEKKEVAVVMRSKSHQFMDCFDSEMIAMQSVTQAFPGADVEEENINQYGVRKKIHFTPADGSEGITVICTEPSNTVQPLN